MSTTAAPPPVSRPRRRWRRRLVWCAAILVGLRLMLPFAIPWALDKALAGSGLRAEYETLSLSLLAGECEVQNLVIAAADAAAGAPPLLRAGRVHVDLDTTALLVGDVVVRCVEVVSAWANLARDGSGKLRGFASSESTATTPAAATPATEVVDGKAPISFALPFRVLSLRVHDLRVHLEDAGLPAPHTIDAEADLTVHNLGDPAQPADLLLHLQVPQCLDALRVQARWSGRERQLDAELHLRLRGLRPAPIAPWVAAIGLTPDAPSLTAEANVQVRAEPHAADTLATALRATVEARVFDRDALEAEVQHASLVIDRLSPSGIGHAQVSLDGVTVAAQRDARGLVRVLGFRLAPGPSAVAPPPAAVEPPQTSQTSFAISADLRDVNLLWRDAMPGMPAELDLELTELACSRLLIPAGREPVLFHAALRLPGVADTVALRDGTLQQADGGTKVSGTLVGNGITLQRLHPLLDAAGVESTFTRGELQASLLARWSPAPDGLRADAELRDLRLHDGDRAFDLASLRLRGLELGNDGAVHIEAVECEGPIAAIRLRSDRTLDLPGLLLHPKPAAAARPVAVAASAPAGTPPEARIALQHVAWTGLQVTVTDEGTEPPVSLAVAATLTADHLVLAGARAREPPGTIALTLAAPGVANATARGQVELGPDRARAELLVEADSLTLAAIRPWLAAAGMEPALADARLRAHVTATAAMPPGQARVDVDVTDVSLRDGEAELLSLGRAHVAGLVPGSEGLAIDAIEVDRPQLDAVRDADGALRLAGLRFPKHPSAPVPAAPAPADGAPAGGAQPQRLSIGEVRLMQGVLAWRDDAGPAPRACRAGFSLQAQRFTAGPLAEPTPLQLTLQLSDTVDQLAVTGDVRFDPDNLACRLGIEGRGLRGGALAQSLPPGMQVTLSAGELLARLQADTVPAPGGGRSVRLKLEDLSLRDGGATLLELPLLSVLMPRLDPAARAFHLSECRLDGLRTTITTRSEGLDVAGLRITPPPAGVAPPADAAPRPSAPAAAPGLLPDLRLDALDLQLAGLRIVDGTRDGAEPLDVSLRLCTAAAWHSQVDDQAEPLPIQLSLTGAALPLLGAMALDLKVEPMLMEPRLEGALRVTGIDTKALLRVRPGLANAIEGGDMTEGTFGLRFLAELDLYRSRRDEFPFGLPFAVRAEVHDVALRSKPDGPLVAGVESISCDVPMFDPRTGDVRAQTIELRTPALHLVRQEDGLHALGLVLRSAPAEVPSSNDAPARPAAPAAPPAPQASQAHPEFAAAEILASGIDLRYTNTKTTPPTELPLDDLDLVVSRFSTAALREPHKFHFALNLGGGDIALPVPKRSSSLITGILSSAASAIGHDPDKGAMAQQPWFDELRTDGELQLFPAPQGNVRVSLGSFEMRCLDSLAEGAGADISDGILDAGVTVALRGEQGISVQSQLTFTHLSMSEPAGGPISTYLKLPVGLDTMLYVLRNDQDEQRVPLAFEVKRGEINSAAIAAEAIAALGSVLADAIAKSPLRVAGAFTGLLGIGGGSEDLGKRARIVPFVPGDASLPADLQTELQSLVAFAAGDRDITLLLRHDLGGTDLTRMQLLANPTPADATALAARLRQELAGNNKERTALAATVEAQMTAGQNEAASLSRARLLDIDRASGTTAAALDATLQLLRPDRDHRDQQRTRAAAQDLATARLQAMQLWLASRLGAGGDARVETRTPRYTPVDPPAGPGGGTVTVVPVRRQRG